MKKKTGKASGRVLCLSLTAALIGGGSFPYVAYAGQSVQTVQQAGAVKGTVTDQNGEAVIGATVKVKNSSQGTVTDLDGNFSLSGAKRGDVIVVSYIGYTTQEVVYKGGTVAVTLKEDSKALDEVVVVGYGTMRKKDLTGSVVQINPEKIADQNPANVQDLLRGTPGLQIGYDPTAKGGGSIQLRGQNSLYTKGSHNSPLIVLDGMAFAGELSEINPDDIAQIDVLKDASSAAIYGAKAASGVIIITTKKGKSGKPTINVSVNVAANTKADYRKMFDANGYMQFYEDWYKATTYGYDENGNWGYYGKDSGVPKGYYDRWDRLGKYGITQEQWGAMGSEQLGANDSYQAVYARRLQMGNAANVYDNYLAGKTYDWEDATFRTGFNQDYNASISGASDKVNYYISAGYLKNQGVVRGQDYHAFRSNMKVNANVTDWFEIGANINFQDRSDGDISAPYKTGAYWFNNATMFFNSPYAPRYDAEGNELQYPMNGTSTNGGVNFWFSRPYEDLEKGYTVLNTIFNAKVKLPFGITYSFNIAPRYQWHYDRYFTSAELPNSDPKGRGVNRKSSKNFDWNLNNTITWDHTFNNLHHFTLTLVQEAEEFRYWNDNIEAKYITPTDALGFHYIAGADKELSKFWTSDTHSSAAAYLGRLFYGFNDKYMVTGTVRRDGYSAFGSNNPWATFYSVGASWRFSEEKFADLPWLDDGKLRVSYGTNGNRSLEDTYLSLANLKDGGKIAYLDKNGNPVILNSLEMDRLASPNLEWEKTTAWNVGLDFSLFNHRLTGSIEWYSKKTHDMIMSQRLPVFTGFDKITTNLGEVTNKGFEISLNSVNIQNDKFTWTTSLGFSYNKNRIKHLYYDYDENGVERDDTSNGWFINRPVGEIWDYETNGIWQLSEAAEAQKVGQKPGDPKVINHFTEDDIVNADGTRTPVYNEKDKTFLGTTQPPIYWNMRNDFTLFKNLTIGISMYAYMGHKSTAKYFMNGDNGGSMVTNCFNLFEKEYWTPENPTNDYARLGAVGPTGIADAVSKVYSMDFLRIDNISIGYTLPKAWIKPLQLEKVHITASINNLCTFTGWEYGDPELNAYWIGNESTIVPSTRSFNFGLNVTF